MSDTIIIKACLNGGRGREQNGNVPWTPAEVAAEARRCYEAGASIVHFHARDQSGVSSHDPVWYAEADRLIRSQTPLLTNHTTSRGPNETVEPVLRHLKEAPPDMCSCNMGHLITHRGAPGKRQTVISPNSYADIAAILETCYSTGTFAEPAIFDLGFFNTALTLINDGALRHTSYFLLEFPGGSWGDGRAFATGTPENYLLLREAVRRQYPNAVCVSHGVGANVFRLGALAIANGDGIRVGFEDWVHLPNGDLARSSADLVAWAATIAAACGRTPATPAQAARLIRGEAPPAA